MIAQTKVLDLLLLIVSMVVYTSSVLLITSKYGVQNALLSYSLIKNDNNIRRLFLFFILCVVVPIAIVSNTYIMFVACAILVLSSIIYTFRLVPLNEVVMIFSVVIAFILGLGDMTINHHIGFYILGVVFLIYIVDNAFKYPVWMIQNILYYTIWTTLLIDKVIND